MTRSPVIDYFFSVQSDWAYVGGERFEQLARRHGALVNYRPLKLADLYAKTGGIVLQKRSRQRQDYRVVELVRWRDRLGIPITLHPKHYPTDDKLASCIIIAASRLKADVGRLINSIHRAIWVEEQDIADETTLARIVSGLHLDANELMRVAREAEIEEELERNTNEAAERGVFGSPFYLFGADIFWGQDRLEFLDDALARHMREDAIHGRNAV